MILINECARNCLLGTQVRYIVVLKIEDVSQMRFSQKNLI